MIRSASNFIVFMYVITHCFYKLPIHLMLFGCDQVVSCQVESFTVYRVDL